MLCHMRWGAFLLFAGFVVIATIYVFFLVPETKGMPIEEIDLVFASHRVWKRYVVIDTSGMLVALRCVGKKQLMIVSRCGEHGGLSGQACQVTHHPSVFDFFRVICLACQFCWRLPPHFSAGGF